MSWLPAGGSNGRFPRKSSRPTSSKLSETLRSSRLPSRSSTTRASCSQIETSLGGNSSGGNPGSATREGVTSNAILRAPSSASAASRSWMNPDGTVHGSPAANSTGGVTGAGSPDLPLNSRMTGYRLLAKHPTGWPSVSSTRLTLSNVAGSVRSRLLSPARSATSVFSSLSDTELGGNSRSGTALSATTCRDGVIWKSIREVSFAGPEESRPRRNPDGTLHCSPGLNTLVAVTGGRSPTFPVNFRRMG